MRPAHPVLRAIVSALLFAGVAMGGLLVLPSLPIPPAALATKRPTPHRQHPRRPAINVVDIPAAAAARGPVRR